MIKNLFFPAYCMMLAFALAGCGKEAGLEPGNAKDNYFAVDPAATDPESVLRRDFFTAESIHLMFNDTLRYELLGEDRYGNPVYFTETIDLLYTFSNGQSVAMSDSKLKFTLLDDMAVKQAAARFLREKVLPPVGGGLRPYSVLIVEAIDRYQHNNPSDDYYFAESLGMFAGMRCTAFAFADFAEMNEAELAALKTQVQKGLVVPKLTALGTDVLADFYRYSQDYYNKYKSNLGVSSGSGVEPLHPFGFITDRSSSYTPNSSQDLEDFAGAVFDYSEVEFTAAFGDYPLIMNKYRVIRELMKSMGLDISML